MALINRITGKSLEQEVAQNQQLSQQQPLESSDPESPVPPKLNRKKQPSTKIPPHTAMYLLEAAGQKLDVLTDLTARMEALLSAEEQRAEQKNPSSEKDAAFERSADEAAADCAERFDALCKLIVEQRLSDADKQGERLADKLFKTVQQAAGLYRLLTVLLILSGCTLAALIVVIILLH